jgi:hypothetical protein
MELLVAVDDYCVTKIIAAASAAGVPLPVRKGYSHSQLTDIDNAAKSILLKTKQGNITQHVAMLRYIAELAPASGLAGISSFDTAIVDQWLDFSWNELGD